jgi:hypothetical protein
MSSTLGVSGRSGRRAATVFGAAALAIAAFIPAGTAATRTAGSHLLGISVQSYPAYDRVVLDLSAIPGYTVTATDELTGQGSGKDVTLPNSNTYLNVELNPADTQGYSGPTLVTTTYPEVKAVQQMGAFEGYTQVGIGLQHVSSYTVTVLSPTQLAIDVAH